MAGSRRLEFRSKIFGSVCKRSRREIHLGIRIRVRLDVVLVEQTEFLMKIRSLADL